MKRLLLALTAISLPVFAQTTTTVQTQQQPPPPPSTTVTTQTNPPPPSTQVVVNPNDPNVPPAAVSTVETTSTGRSAASIIATDALYGGFTGVLIGGAVTLIDQGNNWQRDLMVGAGIGILAGAAFGIYDSTTQPKTVTRAVSDRNNAASDPGGTQLVAVGGRF
ncbi:MAG: hypothetical protein ABR567_15610 [Myxococcales bacterium]|nr:hypothetical protein [Myxococcales bacterium]